MSMTLTKVQDIGQAVSVNSVPEMTMVSLRCSPYTWTIAINRQMDAHPHLFDEDQSRPFDPGTPGSRSASRVGQPFKLYRSS
jgi:hypothetical protein